VKTSKTIAACFSVLAVFLCGAASFGQETPSSGADSMILRINGILSKRGMGEPSWIAGETSVSRLSPKEFRNLLGLNSQPISAPPLKMEPLKAGLPSSIDWREHGGSYVTGVKNQGSCGSCWAFSMTGALESYTMRVDKKPGESMDLSEQVMLSCSGTGTCQGGQMDASFIKSSGLPPEKFYPYTAADGSCSSAGANWQQTAKKIADWNSVPATLDGLKQALVELRVLPFHLQAHPPPPSLPRLLPQRSPPRPLLRPRPRSRH